MKGSHAVALVALGGGVLYFLSRNNVVFAAALPGGNGGGYPYDPASGVGDNGGASQPLYTGYQRTAPGNMPSPSSASNSPLPGAAVSVGGAGIAAAAGLGTVASIATAGIAAGVGLIAWGIMDKGWFRGGEEGVQVNPARDRFLAQFGPYDYMRDNSNPPGFYGLSNILTILGVHDRLFPELTNAHTMAAFTQATTDILAALSTATAAQLAQAKAMSKF